MAVPAWWTSTTPFSICNPFSMTSASSELDRFSIVISGYKAWSNNDRLDSLFEPVISMFAVIWLLGGLERCSFKVLISLIIKFCTVTIQCLNKYILRTPRFLNVFAINLNAKFANKAQGTLKFH